MTLPDSRPLHDCTNPLCDRKTTAMYCCWPCDVAHAKRYEIHESGPLGHSDSCTARHLARTATT